MARRALSAAIPIGRPDLLSDSTLAAIRAAQDATAGCDTMLLLIAVAYGGHEEIFDAVRGMLPEAMHRGASLSEISDRVSPELIGGHPYLADAPEPDLITRASGELRPSRPVVAKRLQRVLSLRRAAARIPEIDFL